jgi:hypothetical protein
MGGSGGGGGRSYFPRSDQNLQRLAQDSKQETDRQRLDSDVANLLKVVLASCERDPSKTSERLDEIASALEDKVEMERFLFGGSVAKHTYVDGLSDVDALVIMTKEDLAGKSPKEVLDSFHKSLRDEIAYDKVKSVEKGRMAVTVVYRDGSEIQLLPAVRIGKNILIPKARANEWKETNPKAFQRTLTAANERLDSTLVPSIKLMKSINAGFPERKQLTGYHIESLSVEAVKGYRGVKTVKALLTHILEQSSKRVLSPIQDVTGQSRIVDSYLGKAYSTERRIVADALSGVARRINGAKSVDEWKAALEP